MAADLARRGLAETVEDPVVAEHARHDLEAAREHLRKRFGGRPQAPDDRRRAAAHLARRGFDEDTVAAALGLEPWE